MRRYSAAFYFCWIVFAFSVFGGGAGAAAAQETVAVESVLEARGAAADRASSDTAEPGVITGALHGPTPFVGGSGESAGLGGAGVGAASGTSAGESSATTAESALSAAGAVPSAGEVAAGLVAAQRAAALGFPSTAVVLYQNLLTRTEGVAGASSGEADGDASAVSPLRTVLRLGLATALMDEGRFEEAGEVLGAVSEGERGAQWRLRAGLLAAARREFAQARNLADSLVGEDLPEEERGWLFFLRGLLADAAGSLNAARGFFEQAEAAAASPEAQARFALARARALLRVGEVSEAGAAEVRRSMERMRGRTAGLHFARTYAAMLNALGRKGEAVELLQQQLLGLPTVQRAERDEFQLLLGLIGGAGSGPGRVALRNLVAYGSEPLKQRAGLALLAQAVSQESAAQLERDLGQILEAAPEHPILDDLLLVRAQLALEGRRYAQAERDARDLLETFPGSQRKAEAYGVLMSCAWEQFRYRAAADFAAQAAAALAGGRADAGRVAEAGGAAEARNARGLRTAPARGEHGGAAVLEEAELQRFWLGVLVAEAWFRARDYPNAADAYAAVSADAGEGAVQAEFVGDLMFQRVLAEIEAGRLGAAAEVLDALADDPRFDGVSRWQAEWNLARALQRAGQMAEAYARVGRLVGESAAGAVSPSDEQAQAAAAVAGEGATAETEDAADRVREPRALPAELQARMRWLQARLSLLAGEPEETLRLADALTVSMPEGVGEALAEELRSSCALLKAESLFRLGRREAAVALLQQVRAGASRSTAAVQSLIVEAGYYAGQGQSVEAQQLYTKLADDFPDNATYAPYARYQAALQAERRGQDANLEEANKLIEQLVTRYPQSPLVFYARLKQGDLLRKLNQFAQAQQVYESLLNNYPQHADLLLAQLALAECHNAQSMNDAAHANRALVLFEQLRDRVDAPVDVRVEAGLNLGYLLLRGGQPEQAEAVWWRDVVSAFLLDEAMAARLGVRGRYWMTRTLLEVGALYERAARLDQAREAWGLILETGLPGAALAEDRLARSGGSVPPRMSSPAAAGASAAETATPPTPSLPAPSPASSSSPIPAQHTPEQ